MITKEHAKQINDIADKIVTINKDLAGIQSDISSLPGEIADLKAKLSAVKNTQPDYSKPVNTILAERKGRIEGLEFEIEAKKDGLKLLENKREFLKTEVRRLSAELRRVRQAAAGQAVEYFTGGESFKDFKKDCHALFYMTCCGSPGQIDRKMFFLNLLGVGVGADDGLKEIEKKFRIEVR